LFFEAFFVESLTVGTHQPGVLKANLPKWKYDHWKKSPPLPLEIGAFLVFVILLYFPDKNLFKAASSFKILVTTLFLAPPALYFKGFDKLFSGPNVMMAKMFHCSYRKLKRALFSFSETACSPAPGLKYGYL